MNKIFSFTLASLIFLAGGFCVHAEEAANPLQINAGVQSETDLRPVEEGIDELRQELNDYKVESAEKLSQAIQDSLGFVESAESYSEKTITQFLWILGIVGAIFVFLGFTEIRTITKSCIKGMTEKTEKELKDFAENKKADLESAFRLKELSLNNIIDSHSEELKKIEERTERISNFSYYFTMGMALRADGYLKESLRCFLVACDFAVSKDQENQCYFQRGYVYSIMAEKLKEKDKTKSQEYLWASIGQYIKSLCVPPAEEDAGTFRNMGKVYIDLERWDEAIKSFKKVQEIIKNTESKDYKFANKWIKIAKEKQEQG